MTSALASLMSRKGITLASDQQALALAPLQ